LKSHQFSEEKSQELFIFEDFLKIKNDESGYVWDGYRSTKNVQSLFQLLEENSNYYKNIIHISLLRDFNLEDDLYSKEEKNIFKMLLFLGSSFIEKSPLKSKAWVNTLRLLVLENELNSSCAQKLIYRGSNRNIHKSLLKLSQKKRMDYVWDKFYVTSADTILKRLRNSIPLLFKAFIYFLGFILKYWSIYTKKNPKWMTSNKSIFFFSYFTNLDEELGELGRFYSKYWENLPNLLLVKGFQLNWIHLFMPSRAVPNFKVGKKWIKKFNSENQSKENHILLEQFLDLSIIIKVFRDWLKSCWSYYRSKNNSNTAILNNDFYWLWPCFETEWKDSWVGPLAVQNHFWTHLFDNAFKSLPRQKLGFYLQENQSWERIFLHFWRKNGHGKIVGVKHSTICYWDLRHFDISSQQSSVNLPQPDLVAVNGNLAWQMLEIFDYPMERCIKVEALRYQYLNKVSKININRAEKKEIRKLLVFGDIQADTTNQMLLQLEKAFPKLDAKFEILIKPHPVNPIDLKKYPNLPSCLTMRNLKDLLPEIDVVLASVFTSASLDAFCLGLPSINFIVPDNFNFSPLRDHNNACFVSSEAEILEYINDKKWISSSSKFQLKEFFWLDEKLPRWTDLIYSSIDDQIEYHSLQNSEFILDE